ncbi:hypothetical protein HKX48_002634 [Thoreauomyces humboldtii]|nr:hypothetical protein HKX48_002634 [Thoreauomyces humboldtii]
MAQRAHHEQTSHGFATCKTSAYEFPSTSTPTPTSSSSRKRSSSTVHPSRLLAKRRSRSFSGLEISHAAPVAAVSVKRPSPVRRARSITELKPAPLYLLPAASVSSSALLMSTQPTKMLTEETTASRMNRRSRKPMPPLPRLVTSFSSVDSAALLSFRPPQGDSDVPASARLAPHVEQRTYVLSHQKLNLHSRIRTRVAIMRLMNHIHRVQPAVAILNVTLSPVPAAPPVRAGADLAARRKNRRRLERMTHGGSGPASPLRTQWKMEPEPPVSTYSQRVEDVTRDAVAKAELAVKRITSSDSLSSLSSPMYLKRVTSSDSLASMTSPLFNSHTLDTLPHTDNDIKKSQFTFLSRMSMSSLRGPVKSETLSSPLSSVSLSTSYSMSTSLPSTKKKGWGRGMWKGIKRALSCSALSDRSRKQEQEHDNESRPSTSAVSVSSPLASDRAAMRSFIGRRDDDTR